MPNSIAATDIKTILLACEAGMGSSLMSVNALKKKLKAANVTGVTVVHTPAREVPPTAPIVIVHKGLSKMVRSRAPNSVIVTFEHFFNDPVFDVIVKAFVEKGVINASPV